MSSMHNISKFSSLGRLIGFHQNSCRKVASTSRYFCVDANIESPSNDCVVPSQSRNRYMKRTPKYFEKLHKREFCRDESLTLSQQLTEQCEIPDEDCFGNYKVDLKKPRKSRKQLKVNKAEISKLPHNTITQTRDKLNACGTSSNTTEDPSVGTVNSKGLLKAGHHSLNTQPTRVVDKARENIQNGLEVTNNDSDTFGLLSSKEDLNEYVSKEYIKEEDDDNTELRIDAEHRLSVKNYSDNLKIMVKKGQLKEALRMFKEEFIKEQKRMPSPYTFSVLITGCGAVGYTKEAFKLYKMMRDRGMKPSPAALTGLFVACSNSPWKEDGLKRATFLLEKVREHGWQLNVTHYHAMIKAFGKSGGIQTAFQLADEMVNEKLSLQPATFTFLLMACVSNPVEGLKYAIQVWRKMKRARLTPNIYAYNLLLRVIKDCNVGDIETASEVIIGKSKGKDQPPPVDESLISKSSISTDVVPSHITLENIPNVLSPLRKDVGIMKLNEMKKPEERLALFGGMPGILSQMIQDKVAPNIKTFTQFLNIIPQSAESENHLVQALEDHKVIPDIDFCNMLMKRRAYRIEDKNAEAVFDLIQKYQLSPNIMTFGIVALSCRTAQKSSQLIMDMDDGGYVVNIEIIGSLVKNACIRRDFSHILTLMKKVKVEEIATNPTILHHLENAISIVDFNTLNDFQKEKYNKFRLWYKNWLSSIPVDVPQHPWNQYNYKIDLKAEQDDEQHSQSELK